MSGEVVDLNTELWSACAGPLASIPRVGDLVFFFPQGQLEQVKLQFSCKLISYLDYCVLHEVCNAAIYLLDDVSVSLASTYMVLKSDVNWRYAGSMFLKLKS